MGLNWTAIAVFVTMGLFVAKIIWDLYDYAKKKKDNINDGDHEQVHAIKSSLREVAMQIKQLDATLVSIKVSTDNIDGRLDVSEGRLDQIEHKIAVHEGDAARISGTLTTACGNLREIEPKIRNIQEALRRINLIHKNHYPNEDMGIDKLAEG